MRLGLPELLIILTILLLGAFSLNHTSLIKWNLILYPIYQIIVIIIQILIIKYELIKKENFDFIIEI